MPADPPRHLHPTRPHAAAAGVVAAAAALAAGEMPTAVGGEQTSLVSAVGNEAIDRLAGPLKDAAVALFGQNDKVALVVGIVVVTLALGAVVATVSHRRPILTIGGFVGFGVLGFFAMANDPTSTTGWAITSSGLAVVTGVGVLMLLRRVASPPAPAPVPSEMPGRASSDHRWGPADDPAISPPARRQFLIVAGSAGSLAALTGFAGRALRARSVIEAERSALVLPDPSRVTPVPSGGLVDVPGVSRYITPVEDFFRIDTALGTPQVEAASWRLRVGGRVDHPFEVTLDDLLAMDLVEEPVTIACVSNEVGGRLVGNARWLGVPLDTLLSRAGIHDDATQIVGRSIDGFTVGVPTSVALDGRVAMVVVGMNGEPLPAAHGYPCRLVVSGLYGYVSATKWLTDIELTRLEDFDAYWIPRGWAKEGPIKTQSRIDVPRAGATIPAGRSPVAGVAWAPSRGIHRVEVQVDDGRWVDADLGTVASDDTWVQWHHTWEATAGPHDLRVRATDGSGAVQSVEVAPPRPDGATGLHTVRIEVA